MKRKTDEDFYRGTLKILRADNNHPNVFTIGEQLGPYDYEKNLPFAKLAFCGSQFMDQPLVKRAVIEISDGIFYEGEWVKGTAEPIRMGRGV